MSASTSERTAARRTSRKPRAGAYALLILVAAIFSAPVLWLIDTTLKTPAAAVSFPVQWIPSHITWSNYAQALTLVPFFTYARNSIVIALTYAVLTTLSSAFVGFGFARLRGRGKNLMFTLVLSTMMLPHIVTLIPTYLIFAKIHLVGTYWPWVLWGVSGSAFLIFMFRQFFTGIPGEVEEAAIMDGCGYFRMFWRIFLPQARPMLATAFILSFTWNWSDFITPNLLLNLDNTTLSVGMAVGYHDSSGAALPSVQAAGAALYVIPVIVLFLLVQRSYMANSATSGIK